MTTEMLLVLILLLLVGEFAALIIERLFGSKAKHVAEMIALVVIALLLLLHARTANAQERAVAFQPEARVLLHGVHTFRLADDTERQHKWGIAFWFVEPNVLDSNPQGLALFGPRFAGSDGWIELMLGGMGMQQPEPTLTPVFDTRFMLTQLPWLHCWGEGMVSLTDAYGFFQADVPIRSKQQQMLFKVGAEVEAGKTWSGSNGFVGAGPHVILPWGKHLTTVAAFQMRCSNDGSVAGCATTDLVGRLYLVLDFGT